MGFMTIPMQCYHLYYVQRNSQVKYTLRPSSTLNSNPHPVSPLHSREQYRHGYRLVLVDYRVDTFSVTLENRVREPVNL